MPRLNAVEICALLIWTSTVLVRAEDWTTNDGKVYRGITVVAHTNISVTILDADGGATINLLDLPPAIQQKYGMDRAAAQAEKDQEAAADAKVAAEKKALTDQIASEKASAVKEDADAIKALEDSKQKAAADYASADKATVDGQVYFTTSDKQEIDFAATHVRLFSYDEAHGELDAISDRGEGEQKKLDPVLDDERQKYTAALPSAGAAKSGPAHDAAAKNTAAALKAYHDTLEQYYSFTSQDYYDSQLVAPVADVVTDANGKFTMKIPKTGTWVLVALGRQKGDANGHLWIAKVDPAAVAKCEVVLNNDNLAGDQSLMSVMSDADIESLVQGKLDELTAK
jgi:hypothetical protein